MNSNTCEIAVEPQACPSAHQSNACAGTRPWFYPTHLPIVSLAFIVAFAGLFAAGVLSVSHLLDLPVPCGTSGGCNAVATHPSSKFFGVPIAFIGVGAYLLQILLIARAASAQWIRLALLIVATIGTIISATLLTYASTVIHATCIWCVASGAAMLLLLVLAIRMYFTGSTLRPCHAAVFWTLAFLTSSAVGLQAGMMQRSAYMPPIAAEVLADLSIDELIDESKSVGPADSPVTIISFSDPWCPACTRAHRSLERYQARNPNAVRLAYRFMPLWQHSGATAAVAEVAAEHGKFWPFINAVHGGHVMPTRDSYIKIMQGLGIDTTNLESRVADADDPAVRRVWRDRLLGERLGITTTPTFIVLLKDRPAISANQLILFQLLNTSEVQSLLLERLIPQPGASDTNLPADISMGNETTNDSCEDLS